MHRFLRAFWPTFLWMGVIFLMSTDLGATQHTGRILTPLLRWFYPEITDQALAWAHYAVRKGGHVFEYAVMAWLLVHALNTLCGRWWSWRQVGYAFGFTVLFAITDETHQLFVASRGASVTDVGIDAVGAAAGLALAYIWRVWIRRSPVRFEPAPA